MENGSESISPQTDVFPLFAGVYVSLCVSMCTHTHNSAGFSAIKPFRILEKIHILENLTLKLACLMGTIDHSQPLQSEITLPRKTLLIPER